MHHIGTGLSQGTTLNTSHHLRFGRFSKRLRVLAVLFAFGFNQLFAAVATPEPEWPDADTVGLWLFDEPDYLTMMLTDGSSDYYDLQLNINSAHLRPGKFGNALAIDPEKKGLATSWMMGSKARSSRLVPFMASPRRWVSTLCSSDWTIEFWLKLDAAPEQEVVLLDMGPSSSGSHTTLKLAAGGGPFVLMGDLPGTEVHFATSNQALTDGQWHHVAFTMQHESHKFRHFLDGKPQLEGLPKGSRRRGQEGVSPGLIRVEHEDLSLGRPASAVLDSKLSLESGAPTNKNIKSIQWRGVVRAPTSKEVSFYAETDGGVRLLIDGKPVIEHCRAEEPTNGVVRLTENSLVSLVCEYFHQKAETTGQLRIDWSWEGHPREPIPAGMLAHSNLDFEAQQTLIGIDRAALKEGYAFAVGTDISGQERLAGLIDELRFSSVLRYRDQFTPRSFSRAEALPEQLREAKPSGPPLLPQQCDTAGAVPLGTRKHIFIDDFLIATNHNVEQVVNPPLRHELTDLRPDKPWDHYGIGGAHVYQIADDSNEVRIGYCNGGLWGTYHSVLCLATSTNGLNFIKPELGLHSYQGSSRNNIVLDYPGQGTWLVDRNPATPASERIKFMAFGMERGVHVFVSSDGVHGLRRNVTSALYSDVGGGVETFWDDQRGLYATYLRHEGFVRGNRGADGRAAFLVETKKLLEPWPLPRILDPQPDKITEEYPIPFKPSPVGQVYRTGATKYPWAPDVYVAFPWRMIGDHELMQTELATSRDGVHWRFWGDKPLYMGIGTNYKTKALVYSGFARHGDEIWQYAGVDGQRNADVPTAMVAGNASFGTMRLTQRLDGFVALVAGEQQGTVTTREFTHSGKHLEVNAAVGGQMRVAILNPDGTEVRGFGLNDCEPVKADSTHIQIKWHSGANVQPTAGYIVRLKFELQNSKLFAFQFVR